MPVQIHITGETAAEAARELAVLAAQLSSTPVAASTQGASAQEAKRTRKTAEPKQAEAERDPKSEVGDLEGKPIDDNDPIDGESGGSSAEDDGPVPTVVELRAKAQEVGSTPEAKKAIKALLDKFESKSISDVQEGRRAAFLRELEAI